MNEIYVEASKILEKLDIDSLPVSLTRICKRMNISLRYTPLVDINGFFVRKPDDNRIIIVVNDNSDILTQRFSVGHELGHINLHMDNMGLSQGNLYNGRNKKYEMEADLYAYEILMPRTLLRQQGIITAEEIARCCKVSLAVAKTRLKQLMEF